MLGAMTICRQGTMSMNNFNGITGFKRIINLREGLSEGSKVGLGVKLTITLWLPEVLVTQRAAAGVITERVLLSDVVDGLTQAIENETSIKLGTITII